MKNKLDRTRHYREENNELKDTAIETIQNKILRKKDWKKTPQNNSELWDNFKKPNMKVTEIPSKGKDNKNNEEIKTW